MKEQPHVSSTLPIPLALGKYENKHFVREGEDTRLYSHHLSIGTTLLSVCVLLPSDCISSQAENACLLLFVQDCSRSTSCTLPGTIAWHKEVICAEGIALGINGMEVTVAGESASSTELDEMVQE